MKNRILFTEPRGGVGKALASEFMEKLGLDRVHVECESNGPGPVEARVSRLEAKPPSYNDPIQPKNGDARDQ